MAASLCAKRRRLHYQTDPASLPETVGSFQWEDVQGITAQDLLRRVHHEEKLDSPLRDLKLFKAKDGDSIGKDQELNALDIHIGTRDAPIYISSAFSGCDANKAVNEWCRVTGVLIGWGNQFGAREAVFGVAAKCSAMGFKDNCIKHVKREGASDDIEIDLWFESVKDYQRFDADLYAGKGVFGKDTMKLQRQMSLPATHPPIVLSTDYTKHLDSPEQYAKSDSGAGATAASGMRKRLENQRVAVTNEMTYKNMHIIPVALLQDSRKLACRWLFLAGSGEFHDWFDGPERAPHIKVTIDKETPSTYVGETEFTLKVDTSRVGPNATITKPDTAVELPDGSYLTRVRIPSVQADNFRLAINWRANCVDEAWKRVAADLRVNTNDAGGHGWWRCVDLGGDLLSAIEAAKVSLEEDEI